MLKLKTNLNLPQLLCIVVSEGSKWQMGGKLIFDHSSIKPIFTQKLESPGFQIEHQITWKVVSSSGYIQWNIHSKSMH